MTASVVRKKAGASQELKRLRTRLQEAEETLRAIREGEVDAIVVRGSRGEQVFSLSGAESVYRFIVETMKEAAFTVTYAGVILYCNPQFCELLQRKSADIIGHSLMEFVTEPHKPGASLLLEDVRLKSVRQRLVFFGSNKTDIPVSVAANVLSNEEQTICIVANDLTELENSAELIQELKTQKTALQQAGQTLAATEAELRAQYEELIRYRSNLEQIKAKYETLFNEAPDGYVVTDPAGTIQDLNKAAARMLQKSAKELQGCRFGDLLSTDKTSEMHNAATGSEKAALPLHRWEGMICPPGGNPFWASINTSASRDETGEIVSLRWMIRNISRRKAAEEALLRSEAEANARAAELSAVMEAVPAITFLAQDVECKRMTSSKATRELLRLRKDPNSSKSAPESERPAHFRVVREGRELNQDELPVQLAAATGREVRDFDLSLEFDDGTRRELFGNAVPLFDEEGQTRGAFGAFVDITERKRAEERTQLLSEITGQLLASDRPQQIVEAICRKAMLHLNCHAFFNFLADEQAGRLRLNAYAGIPESEARSIEWLDYGVAVCGCAARDGCRIVAENIQNSLDVRTNLVRSYGIQAYACHPLMNQGKVIGTLSFGSRTKPTFTQNELGLMKTVTDHVAIAMQRIRLMESLNRQALAAQAANESKSQFLANMSHELRTPMNAILGMIDVALQHVEKPIVRECLDTAKDSADLLLALLNDLLDTARIESGKLELESEPFSLRKMLDKVKRSLSVRANEKGLSFHCAISEDAPDTIIGDRIRLQQILMNLAGNAIKFTERGSVEISVVAHPEGNEVALDFSVRDSGIGIPASRIDHVFEPFIQADPSMTRRFGGTGLGLPIAKALAEKMGGHIRVESEPDKGSTFYFRIQAPVAAEIHDDADSRFILSPGPRRILRILLAEDNPANQKLAVYVLQNRGHIVEIAEDGHQAIAIAGQNRYDAILMDVQMPGMDGLEATAVIRSREFSGRRIPIIAMTAHAMKGDKERCLASGMDAYISKPINAEEMIHIVESLAESVTPLPTEPVIHEPALSAASAPIFNQKTAYERCFHDSSMVREMIQAFLSETDELFSKIDSALEKGDLVEVGKLGHRMKGTVMYLGAEPAREAALQVERFCKSNGATAAEAEEAVKGLQRECMRLKSALIQHLAAELL